MPTAIGKMLNVNVKRDRRLLRLVAYVIVSCLSLVDLSNALPTTVYDSYGDSQPQSARVDASSFLSSSSSVQGAVSFSSSRSAGETPGETLPPVQQHLLGGVTRVPWYGLTELSDILLLGVLVAVAVIGTLLFVVLVLGLRAKLHLLRDERDGADRRGAADYAQQELQECIGSGSKLKQSKTAPSTPPVVLLVEGTGTVVKPVPTTCIAITGGESGSDRDRTEQHLSQSDKKQQQRRSPGKGSKRSKGVAVPLPSVATVNMSASIGESAIDPTSNAACETEHVTIDDKENQYHHHRVQPRVAQALAEQIEEQQQQTQPAPPSEKRNVLKRQTVAELSVYGPSGGPGSPGNGSPTATAYIQLLTPSSASSLSTSAATTDNNATPTKGTDCGGSTGGGPPLSAAESMAAARFGFSPRTIHSFTVQTATYFRFPEVDDFTPTPRTLPKRHAGDETSCSTPPAVDARTEEEEDCDQLRKVEREATPKVSVAAPSPGSMPLPPAPPAKVDQKVEQAQEDEALNEVVPEKEQPTTKTTSIEPHRPTARICAPMANRRVRLKSISLDSEGARLVEENLTSTIPVQELVGMAAHRTGGFDSVIDDDDDEEHDDDDDDDDNERTAHDDRANASTHHETDDEDEAETAAKRSAARAKRVRNILNLRLNIPPMPAQGTGSMVSQTRPPPPGASQSTGSVAKPIVKTVTVTGSVSNPTMSTQQQQQQQQPLLHHHHHHIEDSNEQFYFEYFDYGDDDDETDDEYDEVEYGEEHEDNNNNNSCGNTVALPPVPKTPTLSQYKQKASSLDSDKLKISVQYGGSGSGGGSMGGNSGVFSSVSCSGGMSTIMSIAQSQGLSLHNTYSHSHGQQQQQQQQHQGQFQFHQQQSHQHTAQQTAGQLQQPRRVSSVSVPTTPKRYQYRSAVNHHYYHQQQHYASGQSKLKPSYHSGPPPPAASNTTSSSSAGCDSGGAGNGNRKEKRSPLGLKAIGGGGAGGDGAGGTTPQSQSPSDKGKHEESTKPTVPTSGRSSILQRRGSNHSLTLNLDVYNRGGSVDLTSSSCSLYRGSYKNLHQVQSHSQLYQPQHPVEPPVRVQCHQASPQQQHQPTATGTPVGDGNLNNNNNNNNTNSNNSKKNLLQRRGSNTSLTLNLRSGVGAGGGGGGGVGSTFGLNRFSSHNSLNTGTHNAGGTLGGGTGGGGSQQHQRPDQQQQQFPSSSLVRLAGSRKSLLERRNSNASLTLINVNQRTLSVSNCNLRGSICSLNSLLTTHTQNEPAPSDMMLEEDELDGNGDTAHHHFHQHHHHHHHHHHGGGGGGGHHGQHGHSGQHHGAHHRSGGEGELRRFGSSVDAPFTGNDNGTAAAQSDTGKACGYGRLTVGSGGHCSIEQHHHHGAGGDHHEESRSGGGARQRKFRSSDSLHNINLREQSLHGCEMRQHGHHGAGPMQRHLMDAESKLMSVSSYQQRSCQSSFDERHHYGSSENFKEHVNKLSVVHRGGLFQKHPATVTSTSSANNLSALGTGSTYNCCGCSCCCGCCCCGGPLDRDGCCDAANGLALKAGNLSISNSNVRNISTKPLSPQTTSEDFKIYLANIQFLQNASNVLTIAYLRKLHNFFSKTYRKMVATASAAQAAFQHHGQSREGATNETTLKDLQCDKGDGKVDGSSTGTKMMLLHSDSLHHPPVCDDESYDEEHKKMVLKIHQEFWDLPTNYQEKPMVFGSQAKNRYKTILPNEHSRVILEPERSLIAGSEPYINANYIKGPDYANNSYIATQGPLPNTIYEFWLMVYQNVARTAAVAGKSPAAAGLEQKIVMLTNFVENGRQKCAIYFPQIEDEWLAFGCTADVAVDKVLQERKTLTASVLKGPEQEEAICEPVMVRVHCGSSFFLVHNGGVEQRNGYTVRMLNVIYGSKTSGDTAEGAPESTEEDEVGTLFELTLFRAAHYWFPDWPDHRSPSDINVLLDLSLDVLGSNVVDTPRPESSNSLKGNQPGTPGLEEVIGAAQLAALSSSCTPTVLPIIHCSAGIGRTGCLIAILNGLRQLRLSVMAHQRKQQQLKAQAVTLLQAAPAPVEDEQQQQAGDKTVADRLQDELEQSLPLPPVPVGATDGRKKSTAMDLSTLLLPPMMAGNGRGQREGSGGAQRESGQVDILGIVCNLRLQRGGMVQNSEQYELIHRALCLYLEKLTQEGHI